MKKVLKWLASALYGLVMIEVVIMISPFAFYWYSLYAPTLQGLHRWRATAWMESFFLPHSVITTSPVLEFMRWRVGSWAFGLGLLAALICAVQVYGTKLFKHKAATGWMYKYIRHPFYASLAVAGFGLLTIWPRIIILVLYLGMLFLYYFLARFEEKQVEAAHPEYAEYRKRTGMFLPGNPGGNFSICFSAGFRIADWLSRLRVRWLSCWFSAGRWLCDAIRSPIPRPICCRRIARWRSRSGRRRPTKFNKLFPRRCRTTESAPHWRKSKVPPSRLTCFPTTTAW